MGGMGRECQYVWVHCRDQDVAGDVLAVCREARRLRMVPIISKPQAADVRWRSRLKTSLTSLPEAYGPSDWAGFWADIDALLAASVQSALINKGVAAFSTKAPRLGRRSPEAPSAPPPASPPPLTRAATSSPSLGRGLTGWDLSEGPPVQRWPSLLVTDSHRLGATVVLDGALRDLLADAVGLEANDLLPVVAAGDFGVVSGQSVQAPPLAASKSLVLTALMSIKPVQPMSALAAAASALPPTIELRLGIFLQRHAWSRAEVPGPRRNQSELFGARYIALLADQRFAYAALSPDGLRRIEASGTWEVLNGQVVLCGSDGGRVRARQFDLSGERLHLVSEDAYHETISIPLQDLLSNFDPPVDLDAIAPNAGGGTRPGSPAPPPRLADGAYDVPSTPNAFSATSADMLQRLATGPLDLPPDPGPLDFKVLGRPERRISDVSAWAELRPIKDTPPLKALEDAAEADEGLRSATWSAASYPTCPLLPGTYSYEKSAHGDSASKSVRLVLRADGTCTFRDTLGASCLQATTVPAHWHVEDGWLFLTGGGRPGLPGFALREMRGTRSVERAVSQVEIPVRELLTRFTFTPFEHEVAPFPGHRPQHPDKRIMGLVDPASPLVRKLSCPPDCLPYSAFQHELKKHGLECDEIISDFHFVDKDCSGQVTLEEMRGLANYGDINASPELVEGLRLALTNRFDSLQAAFEAALAAGGGKVSTASLEKFIVDEAQKEPTVAPGSLREWVETTAPADRERVLAAVNANNLPTIELADFMSLYLYRAVLAVRRVAHFQVWIFEEFGRKDEHFLRAFRMISKGTTTEIQCNTFVIGVKSMGYPCQDATIRSVFSLLDRSFNGKLSEQEFLKLRAFSAEGFLKTLQVLKTFAEDKFGSVDECFRKMSRCEKTMKNMAQAPQSVSFAAFEHVLTIAGFSDPTADLRMIFLFLDEAAGKAADGQMSINEWRLLKAFEARALSGSPARLRRLLEARYGSVDEAFLCMHTPWLKGTLLLGLRQLALEGLASSLLTIAESAEGGVAAGQQAATGGSPGSRPLSRATTASSRLPGMSRSVSAAALRGPRFPPVAPGSRGGLLPFGLGKPSPPGTAASGGTKLPACGKELSRAGSPAVLWAPLPGPSRTASLPSFGPDALGR